MKEQDYLDIEAYLQGELPADDATALEARASSDSAFAAALAERQLLNAHLRADAGEADLKVTLANLAGQHFTEQPVLASSVKPKPGERGKEATIKPLLPRKNRILLISLAAAIILLLVFGGRVFFKDQGATYEQFAQHQPLSLTERGDGDNGITLAEAAFNGGQYQEAIAPLMEYLQLNKEDARARLALGISHLEAGNNTEAVRVLTEVAENGGSVAPYGNWYLALAALRREDNSAALRYLDLIPAGDPYLDERVVELRQVLAE
jgi:tetratricopeptide (TPR) repeat protein